MPELPWEKRERLGKLGLKSTDIYIYVTIPEVGAFFETATADLAKAGKKESVQAQRRENE